MDLTSLSSCFDHFPDAVVILERKSKQYQFVTVNRYFEDLTGYSREEILGARFRKLLAYDKNQLHFFKMQKMLNLNGSYKNTLRLYKKDGSLFWSEISITPLVSEDSSPSGLFLGIIRDITEIIRLKQEILKQKKKHQTFSNKLKESSFHDTVTGIYNRRYFDEVFKREWRIALRDQKSISIFMIDIDYFKKYNDHYGHQAGDICLKKVARSLKKCMQRGGDLMARFGGEEFVGLSLAQSSQQAEAQANFLCRSVKELKLPHEESTVGPFVTISAGVATTVPVSSKLPADLLSMADQALYLSKRSGRNNCHSKSM